VRSKSKDLENQIIQCFCEQ